MLTSTSVARRAQAGVSLLELVVFIVVVSVGLSTLLMVFNNSVVRSSDPAINIKALETAQALMDEILARKFDENTPTGGVPACDSIDGAPCLGVTSDNDFDDVGDYHAYSDNSDPNFSITVEVVAAGADLALPAARARLIRLTVAMPGGREMFLSAYKVNF